MAKVFDYGDNLSMAAKKKAPRTPARRKGPAHQRIGAPSKRTRHASTAVGGLGGKGTAGSGVGGKGSYGGGARGRGADGAGKGTKGEGAPRTGSPRLAPRRILVLDVGGSHVKLRVGDRGNPKKFVTGPKMSAAAMTKCVRKLFA